jgi:DNA-binding MarR family transcriptional regulator
MTRIAELLGRPKTRLTYQIACLQHAGLVTRRSVCGDKRGIEVALTDKARSLLEEASDTLATTVTRALSHVMGPDQHEAMSGLLPDLAGRPEEP